MTSTIAMILAQDAMSIPAIVGLVILLVIVLAFLAMFGPLFGLLCTPGGNLGMVAIQQHLRHGHIAEHPRAGVLGIFQ